MFDYEGSGREGQKVEVLEKQVRELLEKNGWDDRAIAVILEPELEIWLWSDSPELDR